MFINLHLEGNFCYTVGFRNLKPVKIGARVLADDVILIAMGIKELKTRIEVRIDILETYKSIVKSEKN